MYCTASGSHSCTCDSTSQPGAHQTGTTHLTCQLSLLYLLYKQLLNTHTEVLLCLCIDVTIIFTKSGGRCMWARSLTPLYLPAAISQLCNVHKHRLYITCQVIIHATRTDHYTIIMLIQTEYCEICAILSTSCLKHFKETLHGHLCTHPLILALQTNPLTTNCTGSHTYTHLPQHLAAPQGGPGHKLAEPNTTSKQTSL